MSVLPSVCPECRTPLESPGLCADCRAKLAAQAASAAKDGDEKVKADLRNRKGGGKKGGS